MKTREERMQDFGRRSNGDVPWKLRDYAKELEAQVLGLDAEVRYYQELARIYQDGLLEAHAQIANLMRAKLP